MKWTETVAYLIDVKKKKVLYEKVKKKKYLFYNNFFI
jgi:hypothetical protein